jgi:hypothetical protein
VSNARILFGEAATLLDVVDSAISIATRHNYTFISDDWFKDWQQSADFSIERMNFILVLELVEKAHLASTTAVMRARRWVEAISFMYEKENFLAWAAAYRGLLESAGDTLDGLYRIPGALAQHHRLITAFLNGRGDSILDVSELESMLDHYVHAKWMRTKRNEVNVLRAKENSEYVSNLDIAIPNVISLYQKLCSICHPSSSSLDYFYDVNQEGGFKLSTGMDAAAIAALVSEYPDALSKIVQASCIPPLLTLRILHKFKFIHKYPCSS